VTTARPATLCLAAFLTSLVGCDSFFVVRGTLSYCGTKTGIPEATVVATVDSDASGAETDTSATDSVGKFKIHLNKPSTTSVTVNFSKAGFVPLSRQFPGLPTTPYQIDLCLEPAP
jgi:hypothetical protein